MEDGSATLATAGSGYFSGQEADLETFAALTARELEATHVPHAAEIAKNIPIYDMSALRPMLAEGPSRRVLMAEWAACLKEGAAVLVLAGSNMLCHEVVVDFSSELVKQSLIH